MRAAGQKLTSTSTTSTTLAISITPLCRYGCSNAAISASRWIRIHQLGCLSQGDKGLVYLSLFIYLQLANLSRFKEQTIFTVGFSKTTK
jgi:hypothetical protein